MGYGVLNDLLHRDYILTCASLTQSIRTSRMMQRMPRNSFVHLAVPFPRAPPTCTCLPCHFRRRKHISLRSLVMCSMDCPRLLVGTERRGRRSRVRCVGILRLSILSRSHRTASTSCQHHSTRPSGCGMLRLGTFCDRLSRDMSIASTLLHSHQMASASCRHQITRLSDCGMLRRGPFCDRLSRGMSIASTLLRSRQTASTSCRHRLTKPSGCGMLMQKYVFHTSSVDFEIDRCMVRYLLEYFPLASAEIIQKRVTELA